MPNLLNHYDQQTAALAMEVSIYILNISQDLHYSSELLTENNLNGFTTFVLFGGIYKA